MRNSTILCLGLLLIAGQAVAADRSCRSEIGAKAAVRLAEQCVQVEESRHWPCNADNRCRMIMDAIAKGCADLNIGQPDIKPRFCKTYLKRESKIHRN
ncbi:MAG TPA: hypothetical protein VG889_08565 [Rhizomicrobium sp.]|nr:hypothetical protein [Rhizomicrobium sp.]